MTSKEPEKDKEKEFHIPKTFSEFYPKNYIKKAKPSFEEYIPTKQKESYVPKFRKNKFNTQYKKKDLEKEEENSDDEYSGLASKTKEKKDKVNSNASNHNGNKKNFYRNSEDHNDFKTKWKTELCHYWEMYGSCKYGNACAFAHGNDELNKRKMSSNYKTKPCKQFFEIGYCTYGVRCQFSHKITSTKEIEEENKISYLKILKEFNDNNNLISHEIIKRPRLMTFEDITKSGKEMKEKNRLALYEDILELKKKENEEPEKVFSEDTNDGNSVSDEENFEFNIDDYTYNENEENIEDKKEEKRERFISA